MEISKAIELASKELDSAPVPECEGFYMAIGGKIKRIDRNSTKRDKKIIEGMIQKAERRIQRKN